MLTTDDIIAGGLDLLVNLLDTDEDKCKFGALQVLKDISLHAQVKKAIADMNGMRPLVSILEVRLILMF